LRSVYAQTLQAEEVIVIDDGSTDDTKSMLRNDFPQARYHFQENSGVSAARNRGIQLASSQWLAFLDSDDEWLPQKLALQKQQLMITPSLKICHSEEIWIRNGIRVNAMKKHAKRGGDIYQHCLPLCVMSPSSTIIHHSVFDQEGVFDESLPACEDYDLWLRITAKFPVAFIEQPLIKKYGGHADQLSRKYWGMDRFRIRALEKMLSKADLSKENRKATLAMLIKKANIYLQGAQKHNKPNEVKYYQSLINHYSSNDDMDSSPFSGGIMHHLF
jgi:glycosyltransferase involved in cell wall biosynthesis